jgi:hypothetical protein
MGFTTTKGPPSAAHLIAEKHSGGDLDEYSEQDGVCYFCGREGIGKTAEEVISDDYFTDYNLRQRPDSDHVCASCAYCMRQRELKQGHWLAHANGYLQPSTGDLLDTFRDLRAGNFNTPLAVHVTSSPIRSSHSYLWTPVNHTTKPLTVAFDRERIRIDDWQAFEELLAAIEDLRLFGFTFDEIKSGEPRVAHLREIGREAYQQRDEVIAPHRWTAWIELALTLSRSADDQPRSELTDHTPLQDD